LHILSTLTLREKKVNVVISEGMYYPCWAKWNAITLEQIQVWY